MIPKKITTSIKLDHVDVTMAGTGRSIVNDGPVFF